MLTRKGIVHDYDSTGIPPAINTPGVIQMRQAGVGTQSAISAAMPITRPNSSPSPDNGAPFYSAASYAPMANQLHRGGAMALTPSAPNMAMDPSDQSTWQRAYLFT